MMDGGDTMPGQGWKTSDLCVYCRRDKHWCCNGTKRIGGTDFQPVYGKCECGCRKNA